MIQKLRKMSENFILVAMETDFCNLKSFLEKILKYPNIVWLFVIDSSCKKRTSLK